MGVAGVVIVARSDSGIGQFATAVTDANGDYCIGLNDSGSWKISVNEKANQATGYVGNYIDGVNAATGPFSGNDLAVYSIDAWVSGRVLTVGSQPVADVPVELTNVTTGAMVRGETVFDGTYRLGAFAGDWSVKIAPEALGYEPPTSAPVSLTTGQTVAQNFDVSPRPVQPPNTIAITKAQYTSRKKTLTVEASSDYPDANLVVEYAGMPVPMDFLKLFKGEYKWGFTDTNVVSAPLTVTVSGPEGSVTASVETK
jgi:hypothetical protein